ncbi:MAG: molybdopterin-synthase adenylyltransferase MoeB [Halioglobus sp.]|nr:molybdopterin-synthase adenylyltransferase MoeB [Halioglobus sp.]
MLSDAQLLRYNRQILLHDFDVAGQERLLQSRVLVVGLGGLGCPAALYLAAAGVGSLVLADGDVVEESNLQRQIAHTEEDIGRNKAVSAAAAIAAINPATALRTMTRALSADDMVECAASVDLVLDATDNYAARFALNRACIAAAVPLVSAAAVRSEGQLSVFDPMRGGPCYRCLYTEGKSDEMPSCSDSGVLAPLVGMFGSLQAMEALKILACFGEPLRGRVLVMDLRSMAVRQLTLAPQPDCPDCSQLRRK